MPAGFSGFAGPSIAPGSRPIAAHPGTPQPDWTAQYPDQLPSMTPMEPPFNQSVPEMEWWSLPPVPRSERVRTSASTSMGTPISRVIPS